MIFVVHIIQYCRVHTGNNGILNSVEFLFLPLIFLNEIRRNYIVTVGNKSSSSKTIFYYRS